MGNWNINDLRKTSFSREGITKGKSYTRVGESRMRDSIDEYTRHSFVYRSLPIFMTVIVLCIMLSGCEKKPPPNIVWICLDACRPDHLSCYGYARPTLPYIDQIAARGVVFEQHFSQAPCTPPSVSSYMTGRYFGTLSFAGHWRERYRVPPESEKMLPEVLRDNGYETVLVHTHSYFAPDSRFVEAFDEVVGIMDEETDRAYVPLIEMNETILPLLEKEREKPVFFYIHTMDTHLPRYLAPPYDQWLPYKHPFDWHKTPYPEAVKEYFRGAHDGDILKVDTGLGTLVNKMNELGMTINTILLINADHGDMLGEDGETIGHGGIRTEDEIFHVPFIMAGPCIPEGRRIATFTENVDIVPTILDLLDIKVEGMEVDGVSLKPLMRKKSLSTQRDFVFSKATNSWEDTTIVFARSNEYKYQVDFITGEEKLWSVPDSAAQRKQLIPEEHLSAMHRARNYISSVIRPRYQEYKNLKVHITKPFVERLPKVATPQKAFVSPENAAYDDNKWSLKWGELISAAFAEDAPPITFTIPIPNGRYRVQLELRSKKPEPESPAASTFLVKAEDDFEFREIADLSGRSSYVLVEVGEYEIRDGMFDVTLDEGNHEHWAVARGFRFTPLSGSQAQSGESDEELEKRRERLKALGYL